MQQKLKKVNIKRIRAYIFLNIFGFIIMIVSNVLANALPVNNMTTGEVSDRYSNLFVPAPFIFSIWGLIYLLLAIHLGYQLVSLIKKNQKRLVFVEQAGALFFISCIYNAAWIFAWHYLIITLSLLIMFALITTITILYLKLNIGKWEVSTLTKLMVNVPFSIYLGWLSVACIANAAAWLKAVQWNNWGMNEHLWMIIILIIVTALAITVVFTKKDIFYGMVFIWALSGIFFRLQYIEMGSDVVVRVAVLISSAFILASVLFKLFKKQIYS